MYSRSSYYTWIGICIKLRQLDLMLAHKRTHHLVICYKPGRFAACRVYIKPCPRIRGSEYPSSRSIELASLLHPSPRRNLSIYRSISSPAAGSRFIHRHRSSIWGSPAALCSLWPRRMRSASPGPTPQASGAISSSNTSHAPHRRYSTCRSASFIKKEKKIPRQGTCV